MQSQEDLLRIFLPSWLFDFFELEKFTQESYRIDVYLREKKTIPQDQSGHLISHGFTDYSIIQDFPIKGKAVYLHLRRRKWHDQASGKIISRQFEIAYEGTRLTKEFVAFLKATNRK
jgi:transposase